MVVGRRRSATIGMESEEARDQKGTPRTRDANRQEAEIRRKYREIYLDSRETSQSHDARRHLNQPIHLHHGVRPTTAATPSSTGRSRLQSATIRPLQCPATTARHDAPSSASRYDAAPSSAGDEVASRHDASSGNDGTSYHHGK